MLRTKEYKKADRYLAAKKWLRTTDYYKSAPEAIEKMITPLNKKIKKLLKDLDFVSVEDDSTDIMRIIAKNPSRYYMLDLWATWCELCLSYMKLLDDMNLPESLQIINLSTDYERDAEDWKTMHSQIMGEKIGYRLKVDAQESADFLDLLKLKSIPRYIIFDKNLNLIDHEFYAPYEPQFKDKIYDLKNYEYW